MAELWEAVADVDGTVTKNLPTMFGKGEYVYPGKELAIGVSEDAVRSDSDSALELAPVNGFGFAVGFLSQKLTGDLLASAEGMDAWIDTYHAVRRLTREGTYVFLTDSAVGAAEEDNLRHLVTNLQRDVPRERIVPFMTSKHPM